MLVFLFVKKPTNLRGAPCIYQVLSSPFPPEKNTGLI